MFWGLDHSCLGSYLWHLGGLAPILHTPFVFAPGSQVDRQTLSWCSWERLCGWSYPWSCSWQDYWRQTPLLTTSCRWNCPSAVVVWPVPGSPSPWTPPGYLRGRPERPDCGSADLRRNCDRAFRGIRCVRPSGRHRPCCACRFSRRSGPVLVTTPLSQLRTPFNHYQPLNHFTVRFTIGRFIWA